VAGFVKGDVIVIPFPFSDLSAAKRRPALVLAPLTGDDIILCLITSRAVADSYAMPITGSDFASGGLRHDSNVRPNRLFTADSNIILYRAGSLSASKVDEVIDRIVQILRS
jgi:mRNA interferase MazF